MQVDSLRSSALSSWDWCQHKFFIEYGLLQKTETNKAAIIGTCVHKLAELWAQKSLAIKNGNNSFFNDELNQTIENDLCEVNSMIDLVFNFYLIKYPQLDLKDKEEIQSLTIKLFEMENCIFNPLNQNIIEPEKRFTIPIKKPWAWNGTKYLEITGTIDLVTDSGLRGCYNIIDYKTSKSKINWSTGKEKDFKALYDDIQLRLYHFAACQLYPDIQDILMTIVFVRLGESFTIPFERDSLEETENMLRKYYEKIKAMKRPALSKSWKCERFCYAKYKHPEDPEKNVCQFYADKVYQIGLDKTIEEYRDHSKIGQYEGGGRSQ